MFKATLWEHDNYQGVSEVFLQDDPNLSDNAVKHNNISSAKVEWRTQPCYTLTPNHTGSGGNPVASPSNSPDCSAGRYVAGASIS